MEMYIRVLHLHNYAIKHRFQHRRNWFAGLGLAVLTAPMMAYVVFVVMIQVHRHEAYERLETQQLVSIVIPEKKFRWHKTGREILVDGKHFDCKEVKKIGNRYYVSGAFDSEEDLLEQELEGSAHHSSESTWLTEDALFLVFFPEGEIFQFYHSFFSISKKSSYPFCNNYCSIYPEVLSPPPNATS